MKFENLSDILSTISAVGKHVGGTKLIEKIYELATGYSTPKYLEDRRCINTVFNDGRLEAVFAVSKIEFIRFPTVWVIYDGKLVFGASAGFGGYSKPPIVKNESTNNLTWSVYEYVPGEGRWEQDLSGVYKAKTGRDEPSKLPEHLF
jgi:hypothetical protein